MQDFLVKNINKNRLYHDLNKFYPYVIIRDDYLEEVPFWIELFRDVKKDGSLKLLELASGPGYLISHLSTKRKLDVTAVDLSSEMLKQCKRLNPDVTCVQANMMDVRLDSLFDIVLVHDGIGHVKNFNELKSVCQSAAIHLKAGGTLLLSPEFEKDSFVKPIVYQVTRDTDLGCLTIVDYINQIPTENNQLQVITSYYLEAEDGLQIHLDRMNLALFDAKKYIDAMVFAGFNVEKRVKPNGSSGEYKTVFVGTKR